MLKTENVGKMYFRKSGQANYFYPVRDVSLTLTPGAVTVLTGRSGSGKTTLLHLLAGLLTPSEGKVYWDGTDLYSLPDAALSRLRNEKIGVIPQGRSAVDTLTVLENVQLPAALYRRRMPDAAPWLASLGIGHLAQARPAELSGGELRRVAIARALAAEPEVILADEPTGDLDDENTERVLRIFRQAVQAGKAVFLVTHELDALRYADFAYRMENGCMTPCETQMK